MIPRLGGRVMPDMRYTHRPGVYAVLPLAGRILMTVELAEGEFQLPGGGVDPGEHPRRALHREVMEETGWHIARPRRLGAFRMYVPIPSYGIDAEKLCHVYVARPVRRIAAPTEAGHLAVWVPIEEAARVAGNPIDRHVLRRLFG